MGEDWSTGDEVLDIGVVRLDLRSLVLLPFRFHTLLQRHEVLQEFPLLHRKVLPPVCEPLRELRRLGGDAAAVDEAVAIPQTVLRDAREVLHVHIAHFVTFALVPADLDGDIVASVAAGGVCATPGNCRISASEAESWGLGVVQWIDPAEMQVYLGYRNFKADLDLVASTGQSEPSEGLKNFQAVKLGAIIAF